MAFLHAVYLDRKADFNLIALHNAISFTTGGSWLSLRFGLSRTDRSSKSSTGRMGRNLWMRGVGQSATIIAKALGARIIAIDISAAALTKATQIGADITINSSTTDALTQIRAATGDGADVSIDALGSQTTSTQSIWLLRRRGRHLQLGLLLTPDGLTPEPMARVIAYESDILGSHGMAAAYYPQMLAMVGSGALRPNLLVEWTVGLTDGIFALKAMSEPAVATVGGITIIDPSIE